MFMVNVGKYTSPMDPMGINECSPNFFQHPHPQKPARCFFGGPSRGGGDLKQRSFNKLKCFPSPRNFQKSSKKNWLVLNSWWANEQKMAISLLNDEQMSNWVGVKHLPGKRKTRKHVALNLASPAEGDDTGTSQAGGDFFFNENLRGNGL